MGEGEEMFRGLRVHRIEVGPAIVERVGCHEFPREKQQGTPIPRGFPESQRGVFPQIQPVHFRRKCRNKMAGIRPFDRCPVGVFRVDFQPQISHAVAVLARGDPAGRSTGPTVFIVEPGFHPEFLCLVSTGVHQFEPFVPEVFGGQSGARVHEDTSHAHLFEHGQLTHQLALFQLRVPAPKRLPPERRIRGFP